MIMYQRNDIVKLGDSKFDALKDQLWFSDNAFVIAEVGMDGTVSLNELDEPISISEIMPLPISKKRAGNVYYDPIIAASIIGPDDEIPVHSTDYSYFMDAMGRVTEGDGKTLRALVDEQKFKYVHEVQHWLRERYGTDDLKVHHKIITMAEVQYRNLWNLREGLLDAGVSSYQFLYEMANMLYLRWMTFYDEKEAERWKKLEQTSGEDLLDLYQEAIRQTQQQTRIYSASVLSEAIKVVSKCAKQENIAALFDLMLQENSRAKASGAAQNDTPSLLAQLLVELMQPTIGERWYDPAAGFSGFLVEIDKYLKKTNSNYQLLTEKEKAFQITEALSGIEIQNEVARIGFCNTRFHGIRGDIKVGDSLKETNYQLYDGIICEPPIQMFSLAGKQSTGTNKNKQLEFVDLILKSLSPQRNSRAAILLPESFLYKNSYEYQYFRKRLFEEYDLHTILRLPKGIYPNSSISMCAIFLTNKCRDGKWVLLYDMQNEKMKSENLDNLNIFKDFIKAYRSREPQRKGQLISLDEIRNDGYTITFVKDKHQEEEKIESPAHYLVEANKVVREIRSLLKKIEIEVND